MANNDDGRLNYSASLDNSQLRAGAAEARQILSGVGSSAVAEGERIDSTFKKIGASISGVFAVAQMKSFVSQVAAVRGEFQSLEVSFKTMLGSKQEADALMQQLIETAATTPFSMTEVAKAAKQLIAYGVAADEVNETLIRLGDIASGLSTPIGDLAYLYGTTMVQGRMYTQDLNQFLGRGIPLAEELAKQFGRDKSEIKTLVEEGVVGFEQVKQAIWSLTDEGSKFGGMMSESSKTIKGQISNLGDAIEQMYNQIGASQQETIAGAIEGAATVVEHWREIGKVLLTVITAYGSYKAAVLLVAAAHKMAAFAGTAQAVLSLTKEIRSAKDAMLLFNMVCKSNPIGLVLSVLATAIAAFQMFSSKSEEASEAVKAGTQAYKEASAKLEVYKAKIKDCQKQKGDETKLVEELNSTYGETLGQYSTLAQWYDTLTAKGEQYCQMLANQAKLQAFAGQLVEISLKKDEAEEYLAVLQQEAEAQKGMVRYNTSGGSGGGGAAAANNLGAQITQVKKTIAEYNKQIAAIKEKAGKIDLTMGLSVKGQPSLSASAGTTGGTETSSSGAQYNAEEVAKRKEQIARYNEEVATAITQAEMDIRQAQIDAMDDGFEKSIAQADLNYDRLIAENEKRADGMVEALKDRLQLEWMSANPTATKAQASEYRASLNTTTDDLTQEQRNMLAAYEQIATETRERANREALEQMLEDVQTYEQQRLALAEEYESKRKELYDDDGRLRSGVTEGNVAELDMQENEALAELDEQFAQRESTYRAWCNKVATYSLEELKAILERAKTELEKLEQSGGSSEQLATARAKVNTATKAINDAIENADTDPDENSEGEWQKLYSTLQDCAGAFDKIGNAVGGSAGEILKTAGQVSSSALQMINGIVTLVQSSAAGMTATATSAAAAISVMEKASAILAIISAAITLATAVASLFNNDDDYQEEIDRLQNRIDELQWELDHADIVRLQSVNGKTIDLVREKLAETRQELAKDAQAVNSYTAAFNALYKSVSKNSQLLETTAEKLADAYANVAYTANKAFGDDYYSSAREQLENIAQQQLLIQEQIENEQAKKNSDSSQISDWEQEIEELGEEAIELINEMVEEIIGGTSSDIAEQLSDAFFEAFENGEDYAEAWGEKVEEVIGDIVKNLLIAQYLEEPLAELFDAYKDIWFPDGEFIGIEGLLATMSDLKSDLNDVGDDWMAIWDTISGEMSEYFDTSRTGTSSGIANASQDSVDELNGRATAIQGHTYSINESAKTLVTTASLMLSSVQNIERFSGLLSDDIAYVKAYAKETRDTVNNIYSKGVKML